MKDRVEVDEEGPDRAYEAPAIVIEGTIAELTLSGSNNGQPEAVQPNFYGT